MIYTVFKSIRYTASVSLHWCFVQKFTAMAPADIMR